MRASHARSVSVADCTADKACSASPQYEAMGKLEKHVCRLLWHGCCSFTLCCSDALVIGAGGGGRLVQREQKQCMKHTQGHKRRSRRHSRRTRQSIVRTHTVMIRPRSFTSTSCATPRWPAKGQSADLGPSRQAVSADLRSIHCCHRLRVDKHACACC